MKCILCETAESRLNEVACQVCEDWVQEKKTKLFKVKRNTIIEDDIERYTAYMEFAHDGLVNCHPNDEKRFQDILTGYRETINALESLAIVLDGYKLREDQPNV